jgi:hypothetical protein
MVALDREIGIAAKILDHLVKWAAGERHDRAAFRTNQVMPVTRSADYVRWVAPGLKQPSQHVDRGQNLKRSINRRPANLRHLVDELFGGEWSFATEDRLHDPAPWGGHSVTMFQQQCFDVGRLKLSGGRIHAKRVAQAFNRRSCHNRVSGGQIGTVFAPCRDAVSLGVICEI